MPDVLHLRAAAGTLRRVPTNRIDRAVGRRAAAPRYETLAFRTAMALAALWVLDDAFWHREPGTAVGDHLASGLVPVGLAALLALAYPRLGPGMRALAALTTGSLMIIAGVVDGFRQIAVDRAFQRRQIFSERRLEEGANGSAGAEKDRQLAMPRRFASAREGQQAVSTGGQRCA